MHDALARMQTPSLCDMCILITTACAERAKYPRCFRVIFALFSASHWLPSFPPPCLTPFLPLPHPLYSLPPAHIHLFCLGPTSVPFPPRTRLYVWDLGIGSVRVEKGFSSNSRVIAILEPGQVDYKCLCTCTPAEMCRIACERAFAAFLSQVFGEMSLITGGAASASIVAGNHTPTHTLTHPHTHWMLSSTVTLL